MSVTVWHNPRCSKSRHALRILQESGADVTVREYLKDPPDASEIEALLGKLGLAAIDLVRTGESAFRDAGLTRESSDEELVAAMSRFPILIERPVVISGNRALIGRPPERALSLAGR